MCEGMGEFNAAPLEVLHELKRVTVELEFLGFLGSYVAEVSRVRVQINFRSKLRLIFLRKAVFRIVGF